MVPTHLVLLKMSIQLNQLLERTLARAAFLLKKLKSEFEEEGDRKDGWCVCVGGEIMKTYKLLLLH